MLEQLVSQLIAGGLSWGPCMAYNPGIATALPYIHERAFMPTLNSILPVGVGFEIEPGS